MGVGLHPLHFEMASTDPPKINKCAFIINSEAYLIRFHNVTYCIFYFLVNNE